MSAPSADDPPPEQRAPSQMRGLWSVMHRADTPADEPAVDAPEVTEPSGEVVEERSGPRGLWSMMPPGPETVPAESVDSLPREPLAEEEELEPFELVDEDAAALGETRGPDLPEASISIAAEATAEDALGDEFDFAPDEFVAPPSRGWQALLLGIAALMLSGAAYFGLLWVSLITAVCGFGALCLAAAEWTATGPVNRRERWKVGAGGLAGALALVLGPYVFSPLGNAERDRLSGRNTRLHLQRIGIAMGVYQQTFATFPIGGTTLRDHEGRARGGHGWMAAILPHIGEQRLYDQIDFTQAYDEPVNRPAMAQAVMGYYAAGGDRTPNGGGYAVAHFSGVGGEVKSPRGETQPAGVFRAGQPLTSEDLTDGLASTLMVGELGGRYPAWGDPENVRVPGAGLNKDPHGFGNAAHTGALLLFADGHVKFFPNNTDAEVLRRLSTRNAGDLTAGVP